MLKIFVCDDDKNSVDKLCTLINDYCCEKGLEHSLTAYANGRDLLDGDIADCDLLFLDVDMGEENGIALAHEIRKVNNDMILVYVSGYVQYAPAGYNVKAFAYILKNDLDYLFESTMNDVIKHLNFRGMTYSMKTGNNEINIPLKNILYIESFDKTIDIHTNLPQEVFTQRQTMTDTAKQLTDKGFVQIHKSYLVNMQHIAKLKNYTVTLTDGTNLPAAQKRWQDIIAQYLNWRGKI